MHQLDTKQKVIVWVGALLTAATGIYPPWVMARTSAGYGWLIHPPQGATIDFYRLMIEWVLVSVIAAALFWAWPSNRIWHLLGRTVALFFGAAVWFAFYLHERMPRSEWDREHVVQAAQQTIGGVLVLALVAALLWSIAAAFRWAVSEIRYHRKMRDMRSRR